MDGYLKIKTKLDNKDIDKDVVELENKIKKLETDNAKTSTEQSYLQKEIENYEKIIAEADKYREKLKEIEEDKKLYSSLITGKSKMAVDKFGTTVEVDVNTNTNVQKVQDKLKALKSEETEIKEKIKEITSEIGNSSGKIDRLYTKLDKVKAKQNENNAKITQYKQKIDQINLKKVQSGIDGVGKGIQNSIGKLGKMAMAVIGIRTAFGAVKSAISTVSQYNPQIVADFEYMRYCIANLLAPAVQGLLNLFRTVLSYVNAIASAWFGINLFGNASVKNFKKMQNSASGTAKSAKEIQKSLQGFDEMNVLQDNSSNDSGGSGGAVAPSMDLSGMQAEVPGWLQWIIDNKDLIIATLSGIAFGVLAIKFGLEGIKALGIGILIAGIVYTIESLIKYLKDPSWTNFRKDNSRNRCCNYRTWNFDRKCTSCYSWSNSFNNWNYY